MAASGSPEAEFNLCMSSVRESVEWSFHIIKSLSSFVSYDKKMKPHGNQISMYFGLQPPDLNMYIVIALIKYQALMCIVLRSINCGLLTIKIYVQLTAQPKLLLCDIFPQYHFRLRE
ncbi:hypothetical protein H257_16701 [Aphanomyces astaci]|uniref:DDE Tnp4 domain-containing protein n=1 Tax=Aphanomyces astaci TaxID=112090 RepID=W4FJJ5_APHAT|nr:hypothetical protein H257_16701 [Aphanomyces astaci]ETV67009.1 hypothetical protein H257_16701 [Aphanomyces astaci]|eukprot:XP_009843526.1 hypothetical protein H257_16701 [Aphanomyces astaci]